VASYNGNVLGGLVPEAPGTTSLVVDAELPQDVIGTLSLVTDEELPQPVAGTHEVILDAAGVERTIGGWAMYVSGGLVQAGEGIACPPDSGPANREVPQIVRAVP
jgi:hypothetical protein